MTTSVATIVLAVQQKNSALNISTGTTVNLFKRWMNTNCAIDLNPHRGVCPTKGSILTVLKFLELVLEFLAFFHPVIVANYLSGELAGCLLS